LIRRDHKIGRSDSTTIEVISSSRRCSHGRQKTFDSVEPDRSTFLPGTVIAAEAARRYDAFFGARNQIQVDCAILARVIGRENTDFAQRLPRPTSGYTASMADAGDDRSVAPLVRQAAAWSWRLLLLLVTAVAVLQLMRRLGVVVVPVALALIATALLVPAVDWLNRRGAPRAGAVALVLLTGLAVVGGLLTFVVSQFVTGLPGLIDRVTESIDRTRDWLINGPLGLWG
jgi:hypothetical protein